MLNLNYQSLQAAGEHHSELNLHAILMLVPLFFQFQSLQTNTNSNTIIMLPPSLTTMKRKKMFIWLKQWQ